MVPMTFQDARSGVSAHTTEAVPVPAASAGQQPLDAKVSRELPFTPPTAASVPPLASGRSADGAMTAPTTAAISQIVTSESGRATETRTPLARRFTSAAEMLFTAVPEPGEPALTAGAASLAGTSTAEHGDEVKQGTEQKQFAEAAAQTLPPELAAAAATARRGGARSVPVDGGSADSHAISAATFGSLLTLPPSGYFGLHELVELPAPSGPTASSPPELTQAGVLRHVTELRCSGATELAVVLKPDADTQLALRLTFNRNGEVAVQARCEQGDAQALTANWGDLRHALAQQGVRLGALEFSPDYPPETFTPQAGNGGPSPDGQPSSQRPGQPWPETLDDLPLVGSQTESPRRRAAQRMPAGRGRGWESWA